MVFLNTRTYICILKINYSICRIIQKFSSYSQYYSFILYAIYMLICIFHILYARRLRSLIGTRECNIKLFFIGISYTGSPGKAANIHDSYGIYIIYNVISVFYKISCIYKRHIKASEQSADIISSEYKCFCTVISGIIVTIFDCGYTRISYQSADKIIMFNLISDLSRRE